MKTASLLEELYSPAAAPLRQVPARIKQILDSGNPLIREISTHFFQVNGKLLRPALTFLSAAAANPGFNAGADKVISLAAAFEIFHAATLIHDDIIDRAEIRRGLPSVNFKWGDQTAVLAGDFFHDRALITIFENGTPEIMRLFLETAGILCDGEIQELARVRFYELSEAEYFDIIYKKTASLLVCVLEAGARASGAGEKQIQALSAFGRAFGNAFQIIDDCLDFTADQHEFGKTLGKDLAGGVLTLPVIHLLKKNPELKPEVTALLDQSSDPEALQKLIRLITENGALDYALKQAHAFSRQALDALAVLPESPAKQSLAKLTGYILERTK